MNLFNISNDLLDIFEQIEENEGELTPELEERLQITQENFNDKVKSYTELIKNIENDIHLIDSEMDRLKSLKTSKTKAIERIKKLIITALELYGDITKSGVRSCDYGTGKVSIRTTKAVEVDEDELKSDVNNVILNIVNIARNNQLDCYDGINLENIAPLSEEYDEPYKITILDDDAKNIKIQLSIDTTLDELSKGDKFKAIGNMLIQGFSSKVDAKVDKTNIRTILNDNPTGSSYAKLVEKQNIIIK